MKAPVFNFVIFWIGIFPFAAVLYVLKGGVDDREMRSDTVIGHFIDWASHVIVSRQLPRRGRMIILLLH